MGLFTPRNRRSRSQEAYDRMYAVQAAAEAIKQEQTRAWLDGKRPLGDPAADHETAYAMAKQVVPEPKRRRWL